MENNKRIYCVCGVATIRQTTQQGDVLICPNCHMVFGKTTTGYHYYGTTEGIRETRELLQHMEADHES